MVDVGKLAVGIILSIVMVIVTANVLAGMFPSLLTSLTTLNNTPMIGTLANESPIPLRALIAPSGVIPLLLVVGFFLAIVMGLLYLVKGPKR